MHESLQNAHQGRGTAIIFRDHTTETKVLDPLEIDLLVDMVGYAHNGGPSRDGLVNRPVSPVVHHHIALFHEQPARCEFFNKAVWRDPVNIKEKPARGNEDLILSVTKDLNSLIEETGIS